MKNKNTTNRILWGLSFLFAALLLILGKSNLFPLFQDISLLTIILTLCFIWTFFHGLTHKHFFSVTLSLAFLILLYEDILGIREILDITPWTLFIAALLFATGLTILFPKHPKRDKGYGFHIHAETEMPFSDDQIVEGEVIDEQTMDGEEIHFENSFGSTIKYINTDSLTEGAFETSFGEMKLYFDNAIIRNGVAQIHIEVAFGNMVLYVPSSWRVEKYTNCTFGAIDEKNRCHATENSPVLQIHGSIFFGGAEIHYI